MIVAVAGGLLGGVSWLVLVSAGCGWERFEPFERGLELCDPGPGVLEVELGASAGEREPAGDVQQPVADSLGFGLGQFPVEDERLGPDDQVVREHHDLQPDLVERERLERELGQSGVLVVADPVLDVRVLAVAALKTAMSSSVWSVRIAWKTSCVIHEGPGDVKAIVVRC